MEDVMVVIVESGLDEYEEWIRGWGIILVLNDSCWYIVYVLYLL